MANTEPTDPFADTLAACLSTLAPACPRCRFVYGVGDGPTGLCRACRRRETLAAGEDAAAEDQDTVWEEGRND